MRAAWLASQPAAPADMAQLGTVDKEKEVEHGSAKGGREEQSEPSPQQPEQQPQQQHQGHQQLPAASKGAGGKGADAVSTGCGGCGGAVLWRFQCRQAGGQAGFVDHMLVSWPWVQAGSVLMRQLARTTRRRSGWVALSFHMAIGLVLIIPQTPASSMSTPHLCHCQPPPRAAPPRLAVRRKLLLHPAAHHQHPLRMHRCRAAWRTTCRPLWG